MEYLSRNDDISHYGVNPGSRPIEQLLRNGIILLDKWSGPTSHDVASSVKKVLNLNKVGHAGTLDPAVTGVMIITLENACKIIPAIQGLDKEYVGILHLHRDVGRKELESAFRKFRGKIRQKPPLRSAVARKMRQREIYDIEILEIDNRDVLFKIWCQAGTYIRVLCHDIGKEVGGAHMKELRRTMVGRFREERLAKLHEIAIAYHDWKENGSEKIRDFVLPIEAGIEHLGQIIIKDSAVHAVANGTPLYATGICKVSKGIEPGMLVAVLTLKGELVALARSSMRSEEMIRKKGLAAKTDRVIIDRSLYPKI